MGIEAIEKFFPALSEEQKSQFLALPALYAEWNSQINLISRKDMDHFMERHVLHSLALALYWQPAKGEKVIDIGTGGGFPGIPLAILFPEAKFLLVDSIGKKIMVVQAVADALGLKNVRASKARAEEVSEKFDTAVSRAVARLTLLADICTLGRMRAKRLYCLKGGDLREEVEETDRFPSVVYSLSNKLGGEFFETKKVVHVAF
jgi:16S rRNA (guanine527-N7)-methyltransferase